MTVNDSEMSVRWKDEARSSLFKHHPVARRLVQFSSVAGRDNVIGDGCVNTEIPSRNFNPFLLDAKLVDKCIKSMKFGKARGPDYVMVEHILYAHPILVMH